MIFTILLAVFIGVGILILIGAYNSLVTLKTEVDRAWANIDVILKQRFDELPKLIEVIEQYVQYERDVLDQLIEARKHYMSSQNPADKIKASQEMNVALGSVLALEENYPDLKANNNFIQLQTRVSQLEEAISDRRETYNEYVANFNARIMQIPEVLFAGLLGFRSAEMYRVAETDKVSPSLKMNLGIRKLNPDNKN